MKEQMELFNEGGLRDEGGTVEPESGNEVPSGSLQKEVADDIPILISEGEFVFPADVVRYVGLETLMKLRQDAKQGLKMMEKMGQMGNPEEAEIPDDMPFGMADLIVIGSDDDSEEEEKDDPDVKKMQTGGLLDDPRFQRPTGGETPTIGDEDKKEIEDALLNTVYGTITMRRYVNADGVVKYIPFIGDEPQMAIPEGFELDSSAPTPTNTTVTSISDGGNDDSPSATPYSQLNPNLNPFKDQGTANFNIDNLDSNQLVDYYGSFSSPLNRFLSVGVGMLFGGVPALGIATMQQFAQTKGPNSLQATEAKIAEMVKNGEISGDLLDKLKAFQKRAIEKGTGPKSFLSKLIGKVAKGDTAKVNTLTNAINKGDVSTVTNTSSASSQDKNLSSDNILFDINAIKENMDIDSSEPETQFLPASIKNYRTYTSSDRLDEIGQSYGFKNQQTGEYEKYNLPQTLGVTQADAFQAEVPYEQRSYSQLGKSPLDRSVTADRAEVEETDRLIAGGKRLADLEFGEFGESRGELLDTKNLELANPLGKGRSALPLLPDMSSFKEKPTENKTQTTKKRTRKADQPRTGILPRRGERFPDVGLDRPSKFGQTRVDDFLLGVQRDDKGNVANLTEQQQKNIRQNVQEQENIRQKLDQEDRERQSRGFGPMGVQERFDRQQQEFTGFDSQGNFLGGAKGGTFYVGGVPTKPMKPQRLKKGGLAKPKVKPKRMKKGGLASKK